MEPPWISGVFRQLGAAGRHLGELLTAALNGNGMLWKTAPAMTELEQVTLSWLRQWSGLPDDWFGLIYDTASTIEHACSGGGAGGGRTGIANGRLAEGANGLYVGAIALVD